MTRKIDFGEGIKWAAHRQEHWLDFAGNPNFPDYLRLVFVAYGLHAANGHAVLDRGMLARYLVRKDGTLPDRRTLWGALQKSIRLGYLVETSQLLCLVVGSHDVQKRAKGEDPDAPCRRDHTKRQVAAKAQREGGRFAANVGADDRRSRTNVGRDAGRSRTNVGRGDRRSSLSTLSLLSTTGAPAPEPPDESEAG